MPSTEINTLNISYQVAGEGDVILLLHGWGGEAASFQHRFLNGLRNLIKSTRWICRDSGRVKFPLQHGTRLTTRSLLQRFWKNCASQRCISLVTPSAVGFRLSFQRSTLKKLINLSSLTVPGLDLRELPNIISE